MYFRFVGEYRKAIDLDNIFSGSCFLLGGAPSLNEAKGLLENKPIVLAAMNNTATIVRPHIWIGADIADNYSASVLSDPAPMKFTYITRKDCVVNGMAWKDIPNTYFLSSLNQMAKSFFVRARDFCWAKNVFILALQLLYRLGFTTIYLVGCEFKIEKDHQYCYDTDLRQDQIEYTSRTYDSAIRQVRDILPHASGVGFRIISCTPDSRINSVVPYVDLESAIKEEMSKIPAHNTKCRHPVD